MIGPDRASVARLRDARERVRQAITAAAQRAGRDPADVTLVAVTKGFGPEVAAAAVAAGLTTLGENRVQEAASKVAITGATWHLIGPLQSNKARRAVELFDAIETVDSLDLARRLDGLAGEQQPARSLPVLLQVNVDADPAKAGFGPDELARDLEALLALPNLRLDGLMTVGRLADSPEAARPTFRRLADLAARLRSDAPALGAALSMGMSDDFEVAIEEGATIVRVGQAIFGDRPAAR
ncbi:MAG TPA: YggS family pyridoxal phosphate-dependent enzyme [Candidatus Limnocylindrales bacterium]